MIDDFRLREHHNDAYEAIGRSSIAAAVPAGWVLGVVTDVPERVIAVIAPFLLGAARQARLIAGHADTPADHDAEERLGSATHAEPFSADRPRGAGRISPRSSPVRADAINLC